MSETPIFTMPAERPELSGSDIENAILSSAEREHYDFQQWEQEMVSPNNPPIWDGPDYSHESVQAPVSEHVEAQPSMVEQHNAMTDAQNVAYIGALTPHMSRMRSQFVLAA